MNKHKEAGENEIKSQSYNKEYADKRRNAKESTIEIGDTVLVKQIKQNKLTTRFNKTPYTVINRKGTKVIAENSKHRITRNVSHLKRVNASVNRQPDSSDSDSDVEQDVRYHLDNENEHDIEHGHDHANNRGNVNARNERPVRTRQAPIRYGNPIPSEVL